MTASGVVALPTRGVLSGHPITGGPQLKWLDRSAPSPFAPIRIDVADTSSLSTLRGQRPWVPPLSRREPDGSVVLDTCEFGAYVLEPKVGRVIAPRDQAGTAFWERRLLNWAIPILLSEQGTLVLHAAGIVTSAGAILVVGASTAGKSTFANAALGMGFRLLSEDGVAVTREPSHTGFLVWPGPTGMRLRHRRDGSPAAHRTTAIGQRSRFADPVALAAAVMLRPRTDEGGPVVHLGAAAAVATLANHSFSHGPALSSLYPALAGVARTVPIAAASLRDSLPALPGEVRRVFAGLACSGAVGTRKSLDYIAMEGGSI